MVMYKDRTNLPLRCYTILLKNYIISTACRGQGGLLTFSVDGENLAERAGFEPAIEFPLYTLSRRAPSATRTPLLCKGCKNRDCPLVAEDFFSVGSGDGSYFFFRYPF